MVSRRGKKRILTGVILFLILPIVDVFLLDPFVLNSTVPGETLFGFIVVIVELILIYVLWRYFLSGKNLPEGNPGTEGRPPR